LKTGMRILIREGFMASPAYGRKPSSDHRLRRGQRTRGTIGLPMPSVFGSNAKATAVREISPLHRMIRDKQDVGAPLEAPDCQTLRIGKAHGARSVLGASTALARIRMPRPGLTEPRCLSTGPWEFQAHEGSSSRARTRRTFSARGPSGSNSRNRTRKVFAFADSPIFR
jgi:hypothetical protein